MVVDITKALQVQARGTQTPRQPGRDNKGLKKMLKTWARSVAKSAGMDKGRLAEGFKVVITSYRSTGFVTVAMAARDDVTQRTPIGQRTVARGIGQTFIGLTKSNFPGQFLAGSRCSPLPYLSNSPRPNSLGARFHRAHRVHRGVARLLRNRFESHCFGRRRLDDCATLRRRAAAPRSGVVRRYMELVAATAVVAGLIVMIIGLLKLGAGRLLSLPIVWIPRRHRRHHHHPPATRVSGCRRAVSRSCSASNGSLTSSVT